MTANGVLDNGSSKTAKTHSRKYLYIAACSANIGAFICGVICGWTSPVIPKLKGEVDPDNNPLTEPISIAEETWIGSLLPVGAILGPFIAGMITDKLGRKTTLLISVIPFILGFIVAAFSKSAVLFCAIRFMWGLSVGSVFTILPMYIAEISEDEVRGALGSFMELFIALGHLFTYTIGPYTSIMAFNIICVTIPILCIPVFLMYIPESPYHLLAVGKVDEATTSLQRLRSKTSKEVHHELLEINDNVQKAMLNKGRFLDIFKSKTLTKGLTISLSLMVFQQLSGICVVLFYTQTIFAATGSSIPPELCAIAIGAVQATTSFITPALVDKTGRRFLLVLSAVGMGLSLGTLGYYFYLQERNENVESIFWLPLVCLIVYIITYIMGFGPVPWVVLGELFPADTKAAATTVTASFVWGLAFIITKTFANVSDVVGTAGSFWIMAGSCAFSVGFVLWYVPETAGKSLQEIQLILGGATKS